MSQRLRWHYSSASGIYLPVGVVVGYDSNDPVPTGWELFTDADGRSLMGTDGTSGVTGGGDYSVSLSSTSSGSHTGPYDTGVSNWRVSTGDTYQNNGPDGTSYGNHNHTVTITRTPARNNCRLIRVTDEQKKIPAGALLMSEDSTQRPYVVSFDTLNNASGYMTANTSTSTSGSSTSTSVTTVSVPHDHYKIVTGSRSVATVADAIYPSNMTHSHSISPSVSEDVKRMYLMVWKATEDIRKDAGGLIVMYTGTVLPAGWSWLTDQNDRFIRNSSSPGARSGSGYYLNVSGTLSTEGHAHGTSGSGSITGAPIPHRSLVTHNHSIGGTSSWQPAYYKIKLMKYIG